MRLRGRQKAEYTPQTATAATPERTCHGMMTLKELLDLVKAGATYLEIMAACKTPEERRAATKILLHTERETWKEGH